MKILFLSDVPLENPSSGSEMVLNQQAIGLTQKNCTIYAITRSNNCSANIKSTNISVVKGFCYHANPNSFFQFIFKLIILPYKFNYHLKNYFFFNVAICHQPFTCLPIILTNRLQGIPIVYVFHSPNHEEYLLSNRRQRSLLTFLHTKVRRMIESYCLKRSQRIIVLSNYMKEKVIRIHKISGKRISINPGGVDLSIFKPSENRSMLKQQFHMQADKVNLLTVRNLEPRMGLNYLLKAMYLLKDKGLNIHLIIGGDGPERKNLEILIQKYGLTDSVKMTGYIPSEILPQYYCAADFFVLPTRHLEGFGLVTVESLACGTPVLGTPVGGTKEILANFDPNMLFKDSSSESMAEGIQSAINDLNKDKKKYDHLRLRCREYAVANYSWQRHVAQLKSVIDELSFKNELAN